MGKFSNWSRTRDSLMDYSQSSMMSNAQSSVSLAAMASVGFVNTLTRRRQSELCTSPTTYPLKLMMSLQVQHKSQDSSRIPILAVWTTLMSDIPAHLWASIICRLSRTKVLHCHCVTYQHRKSCPIAVLSPLNFTAFSVNDDFLTEHLIPHEHGHGCICLW